MNNDSTSFTVQVGGNTFETTKGTLSNLPVFKLKFADKNSMHLKNIKLDGDPDIFRHLLNILRDTKYVVPPEYIENVVAAFEKFSVDYYEFVGRPKPATFRYRKVDKRYRF